MQAAQYVARHRQEQPLLQLLRFLLHLLSITINLKIKNMNHKNDLFSTTISPAVSKAAGWCGDWPGKRQIRAPLLKYELQQSVRATLSRNPTYHTPSVLPVTVNPQPATSPFLHN